MLLSQISAITQGLLSKNWNKKRSEFESSTLFLASKSPTGGHFSVMEMASQLQSRYKDASFGVCNVRALATGRFLNEGYEWSRFPHLHHCYYPHINDEQSWWAMSVVVVIIIITIIITIINIMTTLKAHTISRSIMPLVRQDHFPQSSLTESCTDLHKYWKSRLWMKYLKLLKVNAIKEIL